MIKKSITLGIIGSVGLLAVYFAIITSVSGWGFAVNQFVEFWYFIVPLAIGFGVQIGLYVYLKDTIHYGNNNGKVLAVSGATSTGAMISCCAHYLVNILPMIGIAGVVSVISQYQVELFWVGLLFNVTGILYIGRKVMLFKVSKQT